MKNIVRFIVLGTAVGVGAGSVRAEPPPPPSEGKILVLDNGRTLEGDIEFHGSQFRIRRQTGEVWVPAEPGMRLCADWKEAFALMAAQANQLDPDERVRLARWCQLHGMREQALAEVTAAVQMQPNHREARQMHDILLRTVVAEKSESAAPPPGLPGYSGKVPALDINSESVAMFTTRVQPILMNTCVSCHSGAQAGRFQLYRTYNGGQRAATLKNLASVVPLVNPDNAELSPLLIKAVSPHSSNSQAPLKKESVPFYTLQTWVLQLLANNPQLRAGREKVVSAPPVAPWPALSPPPARVVTTPPLAEIREAPAQNPAVKAVVASTNNEAPMPRTAAASPEAASTFAAPANDAATTPMPVESQAQTSFSDDRPAPPAEPADPFDPVLFNRQTAPSR